MQNQLKVRLSPAEMRDVLLSNAKELMSERFMARTPEVSGLKKETQEQTPVHRKQYKASI